MDMGVSSMMLMMMLVGGGGGNDLVDYLDTNCYWAMQKVEVTAPAMQAQLAPAEAEVDAVRRLMAIRTLGELKKKESIATLKPLLKSKTLFEAEYAAAAIAAIEGKKFKRPGLSAKERMKDIHLLPEGCGVVGQATIPPGKAVDIAKAIQAMGNMGGQAQEKMLLQLTSMLTMAAGHVGNVRIDAVTVGVSSDMGDNTGFVVLIARGRYDTEAVRKVLVEVGVCNTEAIDGAEVFLLGKQAAIFLPSSDRLILIVGPGEVQKPIAEMIAAVKAGKGGLTADSDMGKLIKTVDTASPIWAASVLSDTYRQDSLLAPFDTMTLTTKSVGDTHNFTITAVGSDAGKVALAAKEWDERIAQGRRETAKNVEFLPMFKRAVDIINSMKAVTEGPKLTVTASMKGGSPLMGVLLPMTQMQSESRPVDAGESAVREVPVEDPHAEHNH
jgi:hypothetical protein